MARDGRLRGVILGLLLLVLVPAVFAQDDLAETYSSVHGRYSISYPASWFASENSNVIYLATSIDLLDLRPAVPSGQAAMNVSFSDRLSPLSRTFFQGNTTPLALVQTYSAFWETFGPITETTLGGHPAARVSGPRPDAPLDTVMWGIDLGGGELAIAVGLTASGELAQFEPQFAAIAASLVDDQAGPAATPEPTTEATPPASPDDLPETFTSENGLISLNYPAGWVAEDTDFGSAVIASSEEAFGAGLQPPAGDVYMSLRFGSAPELGLQGATLTDQLSFFMGTPTPPFSEPEEWVIGGLRAASMERSGTDEPDALIVLMDLGDYTFLMAINFTAAGELADFKPRILAILDSLGSGDSEATEVATSEATPEVTPTPTATATPVLVTCIIGSAQDVNLRSGPGTGFERAGALRAGQTAVVNGQTPSVDGTWLRTTAGAWVRSDVVNVPPECDAVATVTP